MIPILDLTRQYAQIKAPLEAKALEILASGAYILGRYLDEFEGQMAGYLNTSHAIGCASGTDALFLALRALNIGAGDEVITTPFSYIATSESIARTGAKPVFVDIDERTFNVDLNLLEAAITPQTKAILPVHIYGQAVDMTRLMAIAKAHNLYVVEDCAQAIGACWQGQKVGTFGDLGCYSFFPTKNLGAAGDGGLVSTNDNALNEAVRRLRVHGATTRYYHETEGINSRLDALQAGILSVKLPHIDNWNAKRADIAAQYTQLLASDSRIQPPQVLAGSTHVFHQYTIRVPNRDAVKAWLDENGVMAMIYYPLPLHLQGIHQNLGLKKGDFPVCERVADDVLSLPIFPELTEAEIAEVAQKVIAAVSACAEPSARLASHAVSAS